MAEVTPSTRVSALDVVNTKRLANHVKKSLTRILDIDEETPLPDVRERFMEVTDSYLQDILKRGSIKGYSIGGMRRETFKDVYPQRIDREVALRVFWRARKTKEKLFWVEGEHITREQDAEFGHLLEMELWGMNGDVTGNVRLRKPSNYLMDMMITPVAPVQYISLNLEIKDGQVQFP